jgi:acylphosphatase
VRNCADESVEMEVQGEESAIDEMLRRIEQGRYLRIENFTASSIPCISENGFSILEDA